MTCESFDAIIVGAGQAGPAIAARCSKEGLRTAVIERGHFGGTCLNVGCVPTKTLVASARAMHLARRGAEFGFDAGELRVDMARVKARKDGIVGQSREGLESWMRSLKETEVIVGEARFVAAATLEVGGRRLTAPRIFLNVGGRSVRPDIPGIDTVPTLDNVSILELDRVPEHLVIVGGSYIGLEFAQMYRRFGAQVMRLADIPERLHEFDAVVSCTASTLPIIGLGAVERALKKRKHRPMFMVDLAVPRDIEAEVKDLGDVYLYTVDDLAAVVQTGRDQRQAAVAQAEAIIDAGVLSFMHWMEQRDPANGVVPLIQQLNAQADHWRQTEMARARRLLAKGEPVEAVMEALAKGLTQKMMHGTLAELHAGDAAARAATAQTVSRLFLREGTPPRDAA